MKLKLIQYNKKTLAKVKAKELLEKVDPSEPTRVNFFLNCPSIRNQAKRHLLVLVFLSWKETRE